MKRHYSPYLVRNPGEIAFDQLLEEELAYDNTENWHIFHSVKLARHVSKKKGECDFIILNKHGILVLEIKGGMIEYDGGNFWFSAEPPYKERKIFDEDPFEQAEGNAGSLISYFSQKNIRDCVIGSAVVFPQCDFKYSGISFDNFWHILSDRTLRNFLLLTMIHNRSKAKWTTTDLTGDKIDEIVKVLAPVITPDILFAQLYQADLKAKKRFTNNLTVLDGLSDNRKIMIQGPPGSGKSGYAFAYMQRKSREGRNGLYLCWNELLAADMNHRFVNSEMDKNTRAIPYFHYVRELILQAGGNPEDLDYKNINKIEFFINEALKRLNLSNNTPRFDYIVVDECQDIFSMGISQILRDSFGKGKNGIESGEFLLLYDTVQSYNGRYPESLSLLKNNAAHYKLHDTMRGTGGIGINELIADVLTGAADWNKDYGNDVSITTIDTPEDLILKIKSIQNVFIGENKNSENMALLFSSNFVSGKSEVSRQIQKLMGSDGSFELIDKENLNYITEKIRYTSSLKFKGLEKNTIILVCEKIPNQEIKSWYQILIGASRAKLKLYILLLN